MRQLKISKSITNRESASLDKYLQEIGHEELLTTDEEVELAQRIRKGDKRALKDAGVSRGFIIQRINDSNITSLDDLQKAVKSASTSKDPVLYIQGVWPTGKKAYFAVPLQKD